jgi:predicted metal-dependent phosphotriesterase family hydrolase
MTHLFENMSPQLRTMGVAQDDLDLIAIDNPLRYFENAWCPVHA